jgi:hypothetical protein
MDRYSRGPESDVEESRFEPLTPLDAAPAAGLGGAGTPWLNSLRLVLAASTAPPSEYAVASSLGVSARTMQRYLRSVGTTFRKERKAVFGKAKRGACSGIATPPAVAD